MFGVTNIKAMSAQWNSSNSRPIYDTHKLAHVYSNCHSLSGLCWNKHLWKGYQLFMWNPLSRRFSVD
uniref:Uncharacterized protein n=1 Tax=Rhizophora mucronata TaxID=61149 RepID=A0A2P2QTM4_RHIMU